MDQKEEIMELQGTGTVSKYGPSACEHCGRKFASSKKLQLHLSKCHMNGAGHRCDQCGLSHEESHWVETILL